MADTKNNFTNIDEYIAAFPEDIRQRLQTIREVIRSVAPEAQEKISYQMPTFYLNGNLIYFAAFKNHIGLYPTPSGVEAFKNEISAYQYAKGSIHLPLNEPLPLDLIRRIVELRVSENLKKAEAKTKKKTAQ